MRRSTTSSSSAGIFGEPGPVADALRAADVQGLADRVRPVSLARVTGARQAVLGRELERRAVVARRMAPLGAREIERDDAGAAIVRRRPRQLERAGRRQRPDPAQNEAGLGAGLRRRAPHAGQRRFDRLAQRQRRLVQQRGVAHLDVPHVFPRRVHHELVRDPLQRGRRLHHRERDGVLLEILLEALRRGDHQRAGQTLRRVRRQPHALDPGQLEHRRRPQAAVEMHVQLRLGPGSQRLLRQPRRPAPGGDDDPQHRARLADRVAGIDRPPHAVGDVRAVAGEQVGERTIERGDGVAHRRPAGDVHRPLVDEHPQAVRAHRPSRWNRAPSGALTGCGRTPGRR